MMIPYDHEREVHPQAESFTEHGVWDFAATPADQYPLFLHFPYFELYRKQVVKQADLVLALHLRGDAFSDEEKARDFDYYEALTVRDSSLSAATQAVIAAEVGYLELAYDYLSEAALIDLDDLQHNTRDGLHIASLAGTWIGAVAGLGGMRDHDGALTLRAAAAAGAHAALVSPHLPRAACCSSRSPARAPPTRCSTEIRWRSRTTGEAHGQGHEAAHAPDPRCAQARAARTAGRPGPRAPARAAMSDRAEGRR